MKVKMNRFEETSPFATEVIKMFSNLAIEGGNPMVVTPLSYINGSVEICVIDGYRDIHSLEVETSLEWIYENWKQYFPPDWVENETCDRDWTPWYD